MQLTEKQSKMFIDWYKDRYKPDALKALAPFPKAQEIPTILEIQEEIEIEEWHNIIKQMLWRKYYALYKMRAWWKETIWQKVFNSLWLNYWPKVLR